MTNNARDFEELHRGVDHAGLPRYCDQNRPDEEPEGLARVVDEVFTRYGATAIENEVADLDEWYDWLHE